MALPAPQEGPDGSRRNQPLGGAPLAKRPCQRKVGGDLQGEPALRWHGPAG
jgi:hypothetical protein